MSRLFMIGSVLGVAHFAQATIPEGGVMLRVLSCESLLGNSKGSVHEIFVDPSPFLNKPASSELILDTSALVVSSGGYYGAESVALSGAIARVHSQTHDVIGLSYRNEATSLRFVFQESGPSMLYVEDSQGLLLESVPLQCND